MRQIKFRAWNKKENKMITHGQLFRLDTSNEEPFLPLLEAFKSNYEVMQYTGVNDINDTEIYEGDILKHWRQDEHMPDRDSGGGIVGYDQIEGYAQLGEVSFSGAWFTYETKKTLKGDHHQIFAPLDFDNEIEVIGNIYEHPHLLKEES